MGLIKSLRCIVFHVDLVAELEPDEDDGEGFEGVGLDPCFAQILGHEVGMGHRAEEEDIDHEGDIPLGALPGGGGVPDGDAYHGDDIGAVFGACAEEDGEHQDGGEQRLTEGLVGVLLQTEVGQGKGDEAWNDKPEVGISGAPRGLAHDAQERDVLAEGEEVGIVLLEDAGVPIAILADDVVGTGYQHRGDEEDEGPEREARYELQLVAREEEKGEAHDAVELDEGAEHDEEGGPDVFLLLDEVVAGHDDGGYGDVELLHLDAIEQLVDAEPVDEHLLVSRKEVVADGGVEAEGEHDEPEEHAHPRGHDGKGRDDQREDGAVVVDVEILGGVFGV